MPSSALVTQLFSSLMRVYRTFPPVARVQAKSAALELGSARVSRIESPKGANHPRGSYSSLASAEVAVGGPEQLR